jgi:hypothetical protein
MPRLLHNNGGSDLTVPAAILGLFVVIFLAAYRTLCLVREKRIRPLPPGPPAEFLLGHCRAVPEDAAFRRYAEWADEYSMNSSPAAIRHN